MSGAGRLERLKGRSLEEIVRLAYRKAVYRKVSMSRYEIRAGDSTTPETPLLHRIERLGPDRFERMLGTNPYLEPADLDRFAHQRSTCVAVYDGDRVAASTWMTQGDVYVHELHRVVPVPGNEHFSCRSYVDPDYRGQFLLSHMIDVYSRSQPAGDVLWGLVYAWNEPSIRSLERLGWRHTGNYWTHFVAGRKVAGESHFPPLPTTTLG